jgi:hypothetical protein
MTFEYEEQQSASRFVDVIWQTHDTSDGTYLAAADACWDMIFIRSLHGNRVLLSGPSTKITPVPYRAGNRNVGIRFHRGTFLTHVRASTMVDTTEALPMPTSESFLLAGEEWPMPGYERADGFIAELERRELLSDDPIVIAALSGDAAGTSSARSNGAPPTPRGSRRNGSGRSSGPGRRRNDSSGASRSST